MGESESIDDILCTEPPLAGDGDARVVADPLAQAGQRVEQRRLPGVRVADEGDGQAGHGVAHEGRRDREIGGVPSYGRPD